MSPTSVLQAVSVVGARPQFIKAAVVSDALARHTRVSHSIVHTGQHYDRNMSAVFFDELGIPPPAVNLRIHSSLHGEMTGRMLESLEAGFIAQRPDVVIVYGDTNSTMAAALAASKLEIPIAHVESGMRSFDRMPEEINRVVTDHVSDILFTATDVATRNLEREGIVGGCVHQVGDVMFDCALRSARVAEQRSDVLQRLDLKPGEFVLCTLHRAASTDSPAAMTVMVQALQQIAASHTVVLPLHPRTRARLQAEGLTLGHPRIRVTEPVGYLDMTRLETAAALIATDSGGVQREAFFHQKPCVTLRAETEWTETVDSGWNVLAPLRDAESVTQTVLSRVGTRGQAVQPYSQGDAGERIAGVLMQSPPALRRSRPG